MSEYPFNVAKYHEGIELFNDVEFFEAHDAWEELWQEYHGGDRKFFQGLIQVAVCLHHFGNGNIRGAKKLFISSTAYLEPFGPMHLGCNIEKLTKELTSCCQEILDSTEEYPKIEIIPDLIPEIHLEGFE